MAHVVFDLKLDEETLENLQELRLRRRIVIKELLSKLSETVLAFESQGIIEEKDLANAKWAIQQDLQEKLILIENRMKDPRIVYDDELELYLELLSQATETSEQAAPQNLET